MTPASIVDTGVAYTTYHRCPLSFPRFTLIGAHSGGEFATCINHMHEKLLSLEPAEPDNDNKHVDRTAVERLQTHLEPRHGHGTIPHHDVTNTYIFPPAMLCRANPD
jgi:hypothetical protein